MKKILLVAMLMLLVVYCSGCATIIGGMIGYQSGEAVAGAAIGAALDIAGAISQQAREKELKEQRQKDDEKQEQERKESIKIYDEEGYIRVGSISARGKNYAASLQKRFENIGWEFVEEENSSIRKDELSRRFFLCKTADDRKFSLELFREENQDLLIFIKPDQSNQNLLSLIKPEESDVDFQSMVTSQVGVWVRDIAGL